MKVINVKLFRINLLFLTCLSLSSLTVEANDLSGLNVEKSAAHETNRCETFWTLDKLAEFLAKEKQPLLALFQIWQNSLNASGQKDDCTSEESRHQFLKLCHQLGIDTRQATVKGRSVHDFCFKEDDWSYLDLANGRFFLNWDNTTLASSETLMEDPLLVLRTKMERCGKEGDFAKAWEELARFEIINPTYIDDQLSSQYSGVVKLAYNTANELENAYQPSVRILNQNHEFGYSSPNFILNSNDEGKEELIWWQISNDKDFKFVPSSLEQIQPFVSKITFQPITETFFNSDETYYIRIRSSNNGAWSQWGTPFAFTVKKPEQINLIEFDSLEGKGYEINWTRDAQASETPIEYLIFGSNAFDFIPSIYSAFQANEIKDGVITASEANDNLVTITTDTKIIVDGSLAYYRIVARQNGQLSVPSPIIHVYDHDLVQPRSVLQMAQLDQEELTAKRVLIPSTYPWTENALPRIGVVSRVYENSLLKLQDFILSATDVSSDLSSFDYSKSSPVYVKPSHVSSEIWNRVRKYFLPENHPWKAKIDRIFAKSRVTMSPDTLKKGGFKGKVTHVRRIFAGTHPECVECFFKIYCDSETHMRYPEWQKWLDRIRGKEVVKKLIKKYGFEKWYTVPHKWIYPLPAKPGCPKSSHYLPKNFILLCSNQRPYDHVENEKMWRTKMTKPMLDALYILLDEGGMWDSVFAFNIPFCKVDGKMCFCDTEYSHKWPVRYEKLFRYLSSENRKYWEYLIRHRGPEGYTPIRVNSL